MGSHWESDDTGGRIGNPVGPSPEPMNDPAKHPHRDEALREFRAWLVRRMDEVDIVLAVTQSPPMTFAYGMVRVKLTETLAEFDRLCPHLGQTPEVKP